MKKTSISILLLCFFSLSLSAQYNTAQNKMWHFGRQARVSFSSGSPVSLPHTSPYVFNEGSASVADANGNPLFFTDGHTVYDRTGHTMPNGGAIVPYGTNSSAHGALIVPVIGNSNQYYIFSIEEGESPGGLGRLSYAIIDITANSGLGDVISPYPAVVIGSGFNENVISVPGENCNIWIICHKRGSNDFVTYPISSSGIGMPIISSSGTCIGSSCYAAGGLSASPDRLTLLTGSLGVELHDFDPATGSISNTRRINTIGCSGGEFSPDGTKLYANEMGFLYQYDLSLPTIADITASRTFIAPCTSISKHIKLGPDGKIYIGDDTYLSVINNPNALGTACAYASNVLPLVPSRAETCFPAVYNNARLSVNGPSSICLGGVATLSGSAAGGTWSCSTPSIASVSSSGLVTGVGVGTASVTYTQGGCSAFHTVAVITALAPIAGANATCVGTSVTVSSATSGGTWNSNNPSVATVDPVTGVLTGIALGSAIISYSIDGACPPATTTVNVINTLPPITGLPTFLCVGDTVTLSNSVRGGFWNATLLYTVFNPTTGMVTGMAPGYATIEYYLSSTCSRVTNLPIVAPPAAGSISGISSVCTGDTVQLTASAPGGAWSLVNSNASVSATGQLIGLIPGVDTACYVVSNSCGSDTAFFPFTVCDTALLINGLNFQTEINISPNPGTGIFMLNVNGVPQTSVAYICLRSITGLAIFNNRIQAGTPASFDLTAYPTGIYLLTVDIDGERSVHKVFKE